MSQYPETFDGITGMGQRAGFIRAIMAKRKAGADYDPTANKSGRAKEGLEKVDARKMKRASKSTIKGSKSKVLKKFEDIEDRTYRSKKEKDKSVKRPDRSKRVGFPTKMSVLNKLTDEQLRRLDGRRDVQYQGDGREDREGIIKRLAKTTVSFLKENLGSVAPELMRAIEEEEFSMYKVPSKATLGRKAGESVEAREKRLAKAREYKKKKGLVKGRKRRGRPRKDEAEVGEEIDETRNVRVTTRGGGVKMPKSQFGKQMAEYRRQKQAGKEAERLRKVQAIRQRKIKEAVDKRIASDPIGKILSGIPVIGALGKEAARSYGTRQAFDIGRVLPEVAIDTAGLLAPGVTKTGKIVRGIAKTGAKKTIGGAKPQEVVFWKGSKRSYDKVAPESIDGFQKIADTPTMDAYMRPADRTILLAFRGTKITDPKDLSADAQLLMNRLANTDRYKKDKKVVEEIVGNYPPGEYEYYLTGHSLAGAVVQQMKRDFPMFKDGVTYNPAFQSIDLKEQPGGVKRIYTDTDFLYNLGGKYFRQNTEVIPPTPEKAKGFFDRIKKGLTPSGIKGHSLDNFKKLYGLGMRGGNRRRRLRRQLRGLFRREESIRGDMANMNTEYQRILDRVRQGEVGAERQRRAMEARIREAERMLQTIDRRIENIQGELAEPELFRIGEIEERTEGIRRNINRDRDTAREIMNRRDMLREILREVEGNIERMEEELEEIVGTQGDILSMDDQRGLRLRERRRALQQAIQNQTGRRVEVRRELEGEVARYDRVMGDIESRQMEMEQAEEVAARARARAAEAAAAEEAPAAAADEEVFDDDDMEIGDYLMDDYLDDFEEGGEGGVDGVPQLDLDALDDLDDLEDTE